MREIMPPPTPPTRDDYTRDISRAVAAHDFQRAVDDLRRRGCRCPLRWTGTAAAPVSSGDAATCAVHGALTDPPMDGVQACGPI